MATYLTGRTRVHTRSGSITGGLTLKAGDDGSGDANTLERDAYDFIVHMDEAPTRIVCSAFSHNGYESMPIALALVSPNEATTNIELEIYTRLGGYDSDTVNTFHSFTADPTTWTEDLTGTYLCEIDVEEVCDVSVSGAGLTSSIYGTDFPNIGGTATADGVPWASCRFYEQALVGGTQTTTATVGAASCSVVESIPSTWEVQHGLYIEIEVGIYQRSSSMTISGAINGWTVIGPYSYSGTAGSVDTTGGGLVVNANTAAALFAPNTVIGKMTFFPPKEYEFDGRLRCFDSAYPGSLDFEWKQSSSSAVTETFSPTFSDTISLLKYTGQADIAGDTDFETVDQWSAQRCWLKGSDLTTEGEDALDWRLQFRGFAWDAFQVAQAGSVTVDDGTSTTGWTAGSNTSLSVSGGAVRLTVSGGEGSATRAFTLQYLEPYRYLRVRLSSSSAQTVRVTIGSSYWDVAVTTSAADYDLDLCCGKNESATVGEVTTRYPIDSPGGYPINDPPSTPYGLGYGTTHCTSIQVSGVDDTTTLDVHDISLLATVRTTTILPPFDYRPLGWDSGTDNTYLWPLLFVQCDDRCPLDLPMAGTVDPTGAGSTSITYYTLEQIRDQFDFFPGTTITNLTQPTDGIHDLDSLAGLLCGLGATYSHGAGTWKDWIAESITSAKTLIAQDLWDSVDIYPGAGNVWTGTGDWDEATVLAVSKSLRGRAGGNIFKRGGTPFPTAETITQVTDPGAAAAGSATSDTTDGSFLTGSTWAKDGGSHKTKWAAKVLETSGRDVSNRQTIWNGFLAGVVRPSLLAYAVRADLMNYRGRISGGSATVEAADNALTAWAGVGSTVTAEELCLAVKPYGPILLGVIDAGSYKLYQSTGGSWALSYTVTSTGTPVNPCVIAGSDGVVFHYWSDAGTVKGRRYDGAGTALGAAFSVSGIGTIDEEGISGDESYGATGERVIRLLVVVSGSLTVYTSTDGEAFS